MAGMTCKTPRDYFDGLTRAAATIDEAAINRFVEVLLEAWREDRCVYTFGNGGSACNASHFVCDFVKTATADGERPLRAMSLVDNIGLGTAIGNDVGYDDVFRLSLASYAKPHDVAVAISCSGNSPNIVRACEWARSNEVTVVALTGFGGGKLGGLADVHINVPSENYGIVEDLHLSIGHVVSQLLTARVLADTLSPSRL